MDNQAELRTQLIAVMRHKDTSKDDLLALIRSASLIVAERFGVDAEKAAAADTVSMMYIKNPGVDPEPINKLIQRLNDIRLTYYKQVDRVVFIDLNANRKHIYTGNMASAIRKDVPGIPDEVRTVFITVNKDAEVVKNLPPPCTLGAVE